MSVSKNRIYPCIGEFPAWMVCFNTLMHIHRLPKGRKLSLFVSRKWKWEIISEISRSRGDSSSTIPVNQVLTLPACANCQEQTAKQLRQRRKVGKLERFIRRQTNISCIIIIPTTKGDSKTREPVSKRRGAPVLTKSGVGGRGGREEHQ